VGDASVVAENLGKMSRMELNGEKKSGFCWREVIRVLIQAPQVEKTPSVLQTIGITGRKQVTSTNIGQLHLFHPVFRPIKAC